MKTYLSVGIGDMMCYDAIMTQAERDSITEIYWACKWGKVIAPQVARNPFYRNVKKHHVLDEQQVIDFYKAHFPPNYDHPGNPLTCKFWHFRGDLASSYQIALQLFNITPQDVEQEWTPAAAFLDPHRIYRGSTFLMAADQKDIDWDKYGIKPFEYILVHYSSDNRPESDIAKINNRDWEIIEEISQKKNWPVVIITDRPVTPPLSRPVVLLFPEFWDIIVLSKYAGYYAGLDSFVAILCAKSLAMDKLYIKTHNPNIAGILSRPGVVMPHFLPYTPQEIKSFYVHQR